MPSRFPDDVFRPPEDQSTKLWRYTDFTKFVSMLVNKGLFFSRIDKLGDRFEGSITKADYQALAQKYTAAVRRATTRHTVEGMLPRIFVNCWHMNEDESDAMWKLYGMTGQAVAIQSTYARLRNWLSEKIYIGQIEYINYQRDRMPEGPFMHQVVRKRKAFEHERELRAVRFDEKSTVPPQPGTWERGDLNSLIERVHLAPTSPEWQRDLMIDVCKKYDLTAEVVQSSLDGDPVY